MSNLMQQNQLDPLISSSNNIKPLKYFGHVWECKPHPLENTESVSYNNTHLKGSNQFVAPMEVYLYAKRQLLVLNFLEYYSNTLWKYLGVSVTT